MGDDTGLEEFRLKGMEQGRLTGVSVAVHAVPDAFLLMHCGVGCKHKATSQLSTHDWGRGVVEREGWTEVGDSELISGASDRIGPYLRSWVRRVDPALVVVIAVTFLELTGEDTRSVVAEEAETVDCDVLYVDALGTHGDLHAGYASVLVELLKRLDLRTPAARPREVGVLGYLFDRYEGDHAGNLAQLKRLVSDIGLRLGPVMLSGRPWADVQAIRDSGVIVQLPYAAPRAKALRRVFKRTDRTVVHADLPVGLRGSTRWMRLVARAAGVPEAPVLQRAAAREKAVRTRLAPFVAQLQGRRVAVFADLPLLAGTIAVLGDLGMSVLVAGIRGTSLGGEDELRAAVERLGGALPADAEVLVDPSLVRGRDAVVARLGSIDGVLASATELNALASLPQEALMGGRGDAPHGPFFLEIGFPCKRHHAATAQPWMGHAGVLNWAQRVLDAPRFWDSGLGTR